MRVGDAAQDQWIDGTDDEARELIRSYPANKMKIVQSGIERKDLAI